MSLSPSAPVVIRDFWFPLSRADHPAVLSIGGVEPSSNGFDPARSNLVPTGSTELQTVQWNGEQWCGHK
jgi:hypothetical protein